MQAVYVGNIHEITPGAVLARRVNKVIYRLVGLNTFRTGIYKIMPENFGMLVVDTVNHYPALLF